MAKYRNTSENDVIIGLGFHSPVLVKKDEVVEINEFVVENYDLNPDLTRVPDGPAAKSPVTPVSTEEQ